MRRKKRNKVRQKPDYHNPVKQNVRNAVKFCAESRFGICQPRKRAVNDIADAAYSVDDKKRQCQRLRQKKAQCSDNSYKRANVRRRKYFFHLKFHIPYVMLSFTFFENVQQYIYPDESDNRPCKNRIHCAHFNFISEEINTAIY